MRVDAQCTTTGAVCPGCGVCSTRVNSSYLRFLADVPSGGRSVVLQLRVRRFRCGNTKCPRRTFVEQTSGLTRRHGQCTERLRSILTAVGLALAGRAGAPPGCRARHVRQSEHGPAPGRGAVRAGGADASGGRRR
ncbi:transposase family protein [Streptomyces sp. PT19]|uniref:transposase family protein n=1 Tax=Streptomyces sp. PT19 TaxID=3452239 RepID=UPI003F7E81DD